jgi:hypothetical protein
MNGSPIAALIRGWVDLYTRGLPADARAARRDEIDDDLWCQHAEATAAALPSRSLDADLAQRLIFGIPADISWRLTYRSNAPATNLEKSSSMSTRTLGALCIVGGLTFGILVIAFIPFSHSVWTGSAGWYGMIGTIVGVVAFSAAAVGLASRFEDHIGRLGGLGAILTTVGAIMSMFGFGLLVPMVIGSAMLMGALARIGVISWVIPVVQLVTMGAIVVFAASQPNLDDTGTRALLFAVLAPYLLTWIATGVSLLRRVPQAQAPTA